MNKTILAVLFTGALVTNAFSQTGGNVTFVASTTRPISYTLDEVNLTKVPVGNPAQIPGFGQVYVEAFGAASGTTLNLDAFGVPNLSSWAPATPTMSKVVPTPGFIPGTELFMDLSLGPPGSIEQMEVVGWAGNYSSFADAVNAWESGAPNVLIGWNGNSLFPNQGALGWTQQTGTATSPAAMLVGSGGYNGVVLFEAPEPCTPVLAALTSGALLLFRRRAAVSRK